MKVRQGFVSNSSSSSFIIRQESYDSVFDLAKTMIPAREWEESDPDLIKKIEEAEIKGMDPNTSLSFGSCNYETYIVKHKDYYLVSTCNNHRWEDHIDSLGHFPDDLKDLVNWDDSNQWGSASGAAFEDLEDLVSKLSSFWYPEYNVGGKPLDYEDPRRDKHKCSEHWYDIIEIKGKKDPVCVVCHGAELEKTKKESDKKKFSSMPLKEKLSFVENKVIEIDSHLTKADKIKIHSVLEEVKRSM